MTAEADAPCVLLDVSPITARPENRTGLARVALSLGLALAARDDVIVSTCAWGSLIASEEFASVRREFPQLRGVDVNRSGWQRLCTRQLRSLRGGKSPSGFAWRLIGQLTNRLRNPLKGIELGHFQLAHSTYARFPRVVRRSRMPAIITVHDVMPLRLPASSLPPGQVSITKRILNSIEKTDRVVCVSDWTRSDFLAITGHPADRVAVIPNGVDHAVFHPYESIENVNHARARFELGDNPYLLTLSSLAPHKNLGFLLRVWQRCGLADRGCSLVLAGGRTRDIATVLKSLGIENAPRGVILTGFVSDADFRALATGAQAFLFPSIYEGFGLPALEAMACGAPVIASNQTSIPEVVGNAGRLIDPTDEAGWADAMTTAIEGSPRNAPDVQSLQQASRFSWGDTAAKYAGLYRGVVV